MADHIQYDDHDLFNPETHHEHSDVPVRPIFWFIAGFIIFGIVSHFALYFLYKAFAQGERKRMDPPQTQVTRPASADVPQNQPLLQPFPRPETPPTRTTPVTDLVEMRKAEDQVLHSYGWVDQQKGVVRIPITEAKKAFAARVAVQGQVGTPVSPATTTAAEPAADRPASGRRSDGGTQ
jgi:hypothetical protein